jgi:hypothetical protein
MVKYVDKKSDPLIGPRALELWASPFPFFAETLRDYLMQDKERYDCDGNPLPGLNMDGIFKDTGWFQHIFCYRLYFL